MTHTSSEGQNLATPHKLETTPPLTEEGYARTFAVMADVTSEYDVMSEIADRFISDNKFREKPVKMLTVGAGRGNFEVQLVKELGLNLEYVCAIEPNMEHVKHLEVSLKSLEVEYDINTSFFDPQFRFEEEKPQKFDFILFCHSLYGFDDPHGSVLHATNFLTPGGKVLIFIQGGGATAAIFSYLVEKSDPEIFSPKKCIGDHSLTADKIISQLRKNSEHVSITTMSERCCEDVDDFVRKKPNVPTRDYKIDFSLQAEYRKLSEETRAVIFKLIVDNCDEVEGRYKWKHWCFGIILSL